MFCAAIQLRHDIELCLRAFNANGIDCAIEEYQASLEGEETQNRVHEHDIYIISLQEIADQVFFHASQFLIFDLTSDCFASRSPHNVPREVL